MREGGRDGGKKGGREWERDREREKQRGIDNLYLPRHTPTPVPWIPLNIEYLKVAKFVRKKVFCDVEKNFYKINICSKKISIKPTSKIPWRTNDSKVDDSDDRDTGLDYHWKLPSLQHPGIVSTFVDSTSLVHSAEENSPGFHIGNASLFLSRQSNVMELFWLIFVTSNDFIRHQISYSFFYYFI